MDKGASFVHLGERQLPEGNCGGNQLLDGSVGLLPLYPGRTTDFPYLFSFVE